MYPFDKSYTAKLENATVRLLQRIKQVKWFTITESTILFIILFRNHDKKLCLTLK